MLAEYGMDSVDFVHGVVRNRTHATAEKERKCKDVSGTLYDYTLYTIILLTLFVMPACSV